MPIQFVEGADAIDVTEVATGTVVRISGQELRDFLAEHFREQHLRQLALDVLAACLRHGTTAEKVEAARVLLLTPLVDQAAAQFLNVRSNRR